MRFEDVEEGDELPTRELFLAKDLVRAYARAANQWSARFTDDEGARKEGLPGMITPGNMSMGLLTGLIEAWAGPGVLRRLGTTFRGLVLLMQVPIAVERYEERTVQRRVAWL